MENIDDTILDLSGPTKTFKEHLAIPGNNRIIFSGAFGTGKTFFIDHFFKSNDDKYLTIKLNPVNYSLASNDDIFELIKFDILFQILSREDSNNSTDYNSNINFFLLHLGLLDPEKGLKGFFEKANQVDYDFSILAEKLDKIIIKDKELKGSTSDYKWVIDINNKLNEQVNSSKGIYERNILSKILYYLIKNLSQNKEIVLIIDDLDRIDPDHIFRILNIFAAHFDHSHNKNENKFGFDRVMLVCDIDNIRNIFSARYGQNTDFSGYIDKFFSIEIYYFDNYTEIVNEITKVVNSINVKVIDDSDGSDFLNLSGQNNQRLLVIYVLTCLVIGRSINLRSIRKLRNTTFKINGKTLLNGEQSKKFPVIPALELLRTFCSDGRSLKEGIEICIGKKIEMAVSDINDKNNILKINLVVPILIIPRVINYSGSYNIRNEIYNFSVDKNNEIYYGNIESVGDNRNLTSPHLKQKVNILPIMVEAISILQQYGILR